MEVCYFHIVTKEKETSLKSNVVCSLYREHLKRNIECFQYEHNCIMESQIYFRNRSLFNELQLVRERVCMICNFRLPVR